MGRLDRSAQTDGLIWWCSHGMGGEQRVLLGGEAVEAFGGYDVAEVLGTERWDARELESQDR